MNILKNITTILITTSVLTNCNSKPTNRDNFEEEQKIARQQEEANVSAMEKILTQRNSTTEQDFVQYLQSTQVLKDITDGNVPSARAEVIARELRKRNLSPALWFTKEIQGKNSRIESGFCYAKNEQGREDCERLSEKVQYLLYKSCRPYSGELSVEAEIGKSVFSGRAYDTEAGPFLYLSALIYREQTGKSPEGTSFDCIKEKSLNRRFSWTGVATNGRFSRFPGMPPKIQNNTTRFLELDKAYKGRPYFIKK